MHRRFTDDQVKAIKASFAAGTPQATIAKTYFCSTSMIHNIVRGKSYKPNSRSLLKQKGYSKCKVCHELKQAPDMHTPTECKACSDSLFAERMVRHFRALFRAAYKDAIARNLEFNLDLEFVHNLFNNQRGLCRLSHIYFKPRDKRLSPALIRHNLTKGWVKGNVSMVIAAVGKLHRGLATSQLIEICHIIAERNYQII